MYIPLFYCQVLLLPGSGRGRWALLYSYYFCKLIIIGLLMCFFAGCCRRRAWYFWAGGGVSGRLCCHRIQTNPCPTHRGRGRFAGGEIGRFGAIKWQISEEGLKSVSNRAGPAGKVGLKRLKRGVYTVGGTLSTCAAGWCIALPGPQIWGAVWLRCAYMWPCYSCQTDA